MAIGKAGRLVLSLENFAPIERLRLEVIVPGLNVITGDNGTGKTRALLALYFLNEMLALPKVQQTDISVESELKYFMLPRHFPWIVEEREIAYSKLFLDIEKPLIMKLEAFEKDSEKPFGVVELVMELREGSLYFNKILVEREERKHRIPVHVIGPFRTLFSACSCPFKFPKAYVDSLLEFAERLSDKSVEVELKVFPERPKVIFHPNGYYEFVLDGKRFRPSEVASGWAELAYFFAYMGVAKMPPRLIALEEPEAHLYPNNLVNLIEYLISLIKAGYGFLVTTHSPLFNAALTKSIVSNEITYDLIRWYILERGTKGSIVRSCETRECMSEDVLIDSMLMVLSEAIKIDIGRIN